MVLLEAWSVVPSRQPHLVQSPGEQSLSWGRSSRYRYTSDRCTLRITERILDSQNPVIARVAIQVLPTCPGHNRTSPPASPPKDRLAQSHPRPSSWPRCRRDMVDWYFHSDVHATGHRWQIRRWRYKVCKSKKVCDCVVEWDMSLLSCHHVGMEAAWRKRGERTDFQLG